MYKFKRTLLHGLLFASLLFVPAIGIGDTGTGGMRTVEPDREMTGRVSFGIYYGKPYYYAPYYNYFPYSPYSYQYYYYPYRPYYFYYGW